MKNCSNFESTLKEKGILKYVKNNSLNDFIKIARLHLDKKKKLYARNVEDRRFIEKRFKHKNLNRLIVNDKTFIERDLKDMLDEYILEKLTLEKFMVENEKLIVQNGDIMCLFDENLFINGCYPKHLFLDTARTPCAYLDTYLFEYPSCLKSINKVLRLPDKEIDKRIEAVLGLLKLKKSSN